MRVRFRVADDRYLIGEVVDVPERVARCFVDEGRAEALLEPAKAMETPATVRAVAAPPVDKMARASQKARPIAPR